MGERGESKIDGGDSEISRDAWEKKTLTRESKERLSARVLRWVKGENRRSTATTAKSREVRGRKRRKHGRERER